MTYYDLPCVSQLALYIFSMHIINGESHSSRHWKLDSDSGKVIDVQTENSPDNDPESKVSCVDGEDIVNLLWSKESTENYEDAMWRVSNKDDTEKDDLNRQSIGRNEKMQSNRFNHVSDMHTVNRIQLKSTKSIPTDETAGKLSCGETVNKTQYDHLRGIQERSFHPYSPEPDVAMIFQSGTDSKKNDVDMNELERKLWKLKKSKPTAISTYSKIGNFWRIKGNTQLSIECFRKVLHKSPNNAEVLLYLARVLYNLQYLDDAISLTRKSLENQPHSQNTWLHHYTLGEILKAYGHFDDAAIHFQHALTLNPGFQPACGHLRDLDGPPAVSISHYATFFLVLFLSAVAIGLVTNSDGIFEESKDSGRSHRHFNRAMAMRSLKHGQRYPRLKKSNN